MLRIKIVIYRGTVIVNFVPEENFDSKMIIRNDTSYAITFQQCSGGKKAKKLTQAVTSQLLHPHNWLEFAWDDHLAEKLKLTCKV